MAKFLVCVALILGVSVTGCSTNKLPASTEKNTPLYIHYGSENKGFAMRFLSAQVQPDKNFWVGGGAFYELSGHVDEHGSQFYVDLTGSTGQESQFYRGKIKLEKAFFGQGGAGSGGIGLMWFIVSTNSNIQFIDEQINASLAGLGLTNHIGNH